MGGVTFALIGVAFVMGGIADFVRGIRHDSTPRHRYDSPGILNGIILITIGLAFVFIGLSEIFN